MNDIPGDDPARWFADFGLLTTTPAGSALAILDVVSELIDRRTVSTTYRLTGTTALLGGLAVGDAVICDGTNYIVRHPPMVAADGKTASVVLSRN
jgi:hypothetical protein